MDASVITTLVSSIGFPIVACLGMAYFIREMMSRSDKTNEKMFDMLQQSNKDNREAIENNTKVLEALKDKLEDMNK